MRCTLVSARLKKKLNETGPARRHRRQPNSNNKKFMCVALRALVLSARLIDVLVVLLLQRKLFESLNLGLLYSPEVFAGFEQLASSVYAQLKFPEQDRVWDANVSALETAINLVTAPPETAAEKEARLKVPALTGCLTAFESLGLCARSIF